MATRPAQHHFRNVAMPINGRDHGDEGSDNGVHGRGMKDDTSHYPNSTRRPHGIDRDHRKGNTRRRSASPHRSPPSSRQPHGSPERQRGHSSRHPHRHRGSSSGRDTDNPGPRRADKTERAADHPGSEPNHARQAWERGSRRSRDRSPQQRRPSQSPSWLRSAHDSAVSSSHSKLDRPPRDNLDSRIKRGPSSPAESHAKWSRHRPSSSHYRSRSPIHSERSHRYRGDRPSSGSPSEHRRRRSRSPFPHAQGKGNPNFTPLGSVRDTLRDRSPLQETHDRDKSSGKPTSLETPHNQRHPDDSRRDRRDHSSQRVPSRSSSLCKESHSTQSRKRRARGGTPDSRSNEAASGPNSIEINMAARGSFRGGPSGPRYPARAGYPGSHDSRRVSQSSGHATPNSSFHTSPPPQSPFGSQSWGGQQQFSTQGQFASQFGQYPPTGPSSHRQGSPSHGPPTGPSSQYSSYPTGPSRGTFRGGGSRGGPHGSQRNNQRGGGFKSNQWNAKSQAGSGRNSPAPLVHDHTPNGEDGTMGDAETPSRPSKELQVEETSQEERSGGGPSASQTRAPPTGPQASKFSFSFKAASKPTTAAPKAEITSKFNALPRREALQNEDKDRRELPRSVPTEPASSRARAEQNRQRLEQQQPPPPRGPSGPRTKKVKKVVRRPKARPTLPDDLAASKSVYFRKPGDESVIGSGTYGKVFKGLHVYTKKLVALKKIRMEGERDGFPVTAVREVKLLQSLKHRNIVDLQEVMVEHNDCFMVFEYLSHDLTGLLHHPSFKLDVAQRKHLAMQLFDSLDYLHKRGVLHRDIKAANILVSSDGILKLADFGLARFYAKRHQLDYTNRVVTIWYRSPELLLGETQYGPAVDVWSAACVLVEIFTKHAIFPGDGGEISQLEKIYAVLGTPTKTQWPALVDMPWFELLRPSYRKPNVFSERYRDKLPPAAFDLLAAIFQYDPARRPTAQQCLEHPYFTQEEPAPRQAIELASIDGDWHEFESKALRREKERREKEARRLREKDRKRPSEASASEPDPKRHHSAGVPPPPPPAAQAPSISTTASRSRQA